MKTRMDFRFELPVQPKGPLIALSFDEAEKLLLENLEKEKANPTQALWQLAQFYEVNKQHEKAIERLRQLIRLIPAAEAKASCFFTMGQAMEQVGDFPAAVRYYREASALEPASTFTWYFVNNNLGYSLNQLGQFTDGEIYCRRAIEVDAGRPNGHKNLGLALSGQGRYREAAQAFVAATQANAVDGRAFRHLEALLKEHPELEFDFRDELDFCRIAVELATKKFEETRPVVYSGWKKQILLWRAKLHSLFRPKKRG